MKSVRSASSPLQSHMVRALAFVLAATVATACSHTKAPDQAVTTIDHGKKASQDATGGGNSNPAKQNASANSGVNAGGSGTVEDRITAALSNGRMMTPLLKSLIQLYTEKDFRKVAGDVQVVIGNMVFDGDGTRTADSFSQAHVSVVLLRQAGLYSDVAKERTTTLEKEFNQTVKENGQAEKVRERRNLILIGGITIPVAAVAGGLAPAALKAVRAANLATAEVPEMGVTAEQAASLYSRGLGFVQKATDTVSDLGRTGIARTARAFSNPEKVIGNALVGVGVERPELVNLSLKSTKLADVPADAPWTSLKPGLDMAVQQIPKEGAATQYKLIFRNARNSQDLNKYDLVSTGEMDEVNLNHYLGRLTPENGPVVFGVDSATGKAVLTDVPYGDLEALQAGASADQNGATNVAGEEAVPPKRPKAVLLKDAPEGAIEPQADPFTNLADGANTPAPDASVAAPLKRTAMSSALKGFDGKTSAIATLADVAILAYKMGEVNGQKDPNYLYLDGGSADNMVVVPQSK